LKLQELALWMIREEFINFFHFTLLAVAVEFQGGQG